MIFKSFFGAGERTRTSMDLRPQRPERCVYTNFTTPAYAFALLKLRPVFDSEGDNFVAQTRGAGRLKLEKLL